MIEQLGDGADIRIGECRRYLDRLHNRAKQLAQLIDEFDRRFEQFVNELKCEAGMRGGKTGGGE